MPQDEVDEEEEEPRQSGAASAVERRAGAPPLFDDDALSRREGNHGLRGRARSLSHTLGELFGGRRSRRNTDPESGEEQQSLLGSRTDSDVGDAGGP